MDSSTNGTDGNAMKTITLNKKTKVAAPDEDKKAGVVAYQAVEFIIDYFGCQVVTEHDTKILSSGKQVVIGGCGYIEDGYELSA